MKANKNLMIGAVKIIGLIIAGFFFYLFNILYAQETGLMKGKGRIKGISGEVSAISKDFIAIVYRRDEAKGTEEEVALPIAKDVIIERKKSLSEIGIGDIVDVEFEEAAEETNEGHKSKRVAKVISFVRAAPPPKSESSVLVSGQVQEEEEE